MRHGTKARLAAIAAVAAMAAPLAQAAMFAVLAVPAAAQAPVPGAAGKAAETPPAAAAAVPALRLVPLSGAAIELSAADLAALPRQTLRIAAPAGGAGHAEGGGRPAELAGVPLRALLDRLGVPAGHDLHGDAMQLYVVAEGADGYRVVLSVAELDGSFTDSVVLVADRKDGRPFDSVEGPLRLIVPMDKCPARWVRQLAKLSLRRAAP